jgi:hypothetical protein
LAIERIDIEQVGNLIEAGLWFTVSGALAVRAIRLRGGRLQTVWILAATFLMFGISDLIEYRTGAWWRPAWLLLLKGSCLLIFAVCFLRYKFRPIAQADRP